MTNNSICDNTGNVSKNMLDSLIRFRTHRGTRRQDEQVNPDEVKAKVIEDINFLRGRIDHIKRSKFTSPNPTIIRTYESMLESREAVLAWLVDKAHSERLQKSQLG